MKGKRCENSNIAELLANTSKATETIWRNNQIVTASCIKVYKYEISVIETLLKIGLFTYKRDAALTVQYIQSKTLHQTIKWR